MSSSLAEFQTKEAISKISDDTLDSILSSSNTGQDIPFSISASNLFPISPSITSFGITVGLSFLGSYLATKKNKSLAARAIAKILGTDVDKINRNLILERLSDTNYFTKLQSSIAKVIGSGSIDE